MIPPSSVLGSAWIDVDKRKPKEEDAVDGMVWWWVPSIGEPVADFWDIPDSSTHWTTWRSDALRPTGPNVPMSEPPTKTP